MVGEIGGGRRIFQHAPSGRSSARAGLRPPLSARFGLTPSLVSTPASLRFAGLSGNCRCGPPGPRTKNRCLQRSGTTPMAAHRDD